MCCVQADVLYLTPLWSGQEAELGGDKEGALSLFWSLDSHCSSTGQHKEFDPYPVTMPSWPIELYACWMFFSSTEISCENLGRGRLSFCDPERDFLGDSVGRSCWFSFGLGGILLKRWNFILWCSRNSVVGVSVLCFGFFFPLLLLLLLT